MAAEKDSTTGIDQAAPKRVSLDRVGIHRVLMGAVHEGRFVSHWENEWGFIFC